MSTTKISMNIEHPIEVGNVDVVFYVRRGNALLGKLHLSKGGMDWWPKSARSPRRTNWETFDSWMKTDA